MAISSFSDFSFFCPEGTPLEYQRALYAQAFLETGGFSSHLFKSANNLFGMKLAQKRKQVGVISSLPAPDGGAYAVYDSIESSVLDRIALDKFNGSPIPDNVLEVPAYFQEVCQTYAADPNYYSKLLGVYNGAVGQSGAASGSGDPTAGGFSFASILKFLPLLAIGYFIYKRVIKK